MILDTLQNLPLYFPLHPMLPAVEMFLRRAGKESLAEGRHEIAGPAGWGLIRRYDTVSFSQQPMEAHRDFIDIQYILSGEEMLGWADRAVLTPLAPYSQADDCALYAGTPQWIALTPGHFAILFPGDAHLPKIASGSIRHVEKAIVKIRVKP